MLTSDTAIAWLEANAWSMFSIFGAGSGGSMLDTPQRLIVEAPLPQPPYNAVLRFRDDGTGPLTEQVANEWARFTRRGVNGLFLRHPTAPAGLDAALVANGLEQADRLVGMAMDLTTELPVQRNLEGVHLLEAADADAADWVDPVTWRYGLESTTEGYLRDIYLRAVGTHARLFIARIDGRPVSKVALHLTDGVAGIYGVATTEHGRRRGLASALTIAALHRARELGAAVSVLHSTPMAHDLYAAIGYRDVAPFGVWAEPATLHPRPGPPRSARHRTSG